MKLNFKIPTILFVLSALFFLFSSFIMYNQEVELQKAELKYKETYQQCEQQLGTSYNMLADLYEECELYLYSIDVINKYSIEYDVEPEIIIAVMKLESNFKPTLISNDNYGIMQINKIHLPSFEDKMEILGFKKNVECGVSLLSGLKEQSSDLNYILNSYNMSQYGYKDYVKRTGKVSREYSRKGIQIIKNLKGETDNDN